MTKKQLITKIEDVLEKYQFYRNGALWNRDYADFVDVIDLQISKSKDMFTINAGVADKFIIRACWGMDGSSMVDEPSCTVRARLGELLHGRDVWWSLSNDDGIEEVLSDIEGVLIPFLQRNHSIDHMIESIENNPAARRYGSGEIFIALLYHRKGESERCKEMFENMKLTGAWKQKASDILASLN